LSRVVEQSVRTTALLLTNSHVAEPCMLFRFATKFSRKPEARSLFPFYWLNSCNDSSFAGMMLTLHKSQVHCSGVMQWWELAVHSCSIFSLQG